jgi:alpha-beta hydrolase superfamily lysophospholipase
MEVEYCSGTIVSIPFNQHKIDVIFRHLVTHKEHVEKKPIIIRIHGTIGNLLDETEHFLPTVFAHEGYSSITMNTLLANLGLFYGFGIFDDVIPQIDAVCDFVRGMGFRKLVLAGHGLGGCIAIRYGALRNNPVKYPDILGVIAIATPYSMPDTIHRRWKKFASEPEYVEICRWAQRLFNPEHGEEPARDKTIVVRKAHGSTSLPEHTEIFTLKSWWALAGPEAEGAKTHKHIGNIKLPILLIQGLHDDIIEPREAADLEHLAKEAGNTDVSSSYLAAGHTFEGKHAELGQIIIQWLNDRFE